MNDSQAQQFLTIVKHMNLSKAAKELYISQPALSLSLSRLEKEVGVQLFYRDGNKLVMSPEGEELFSHFQELKNVHKKLMKKAEELSRAQDEYITIGFFGSAFQFAAFQTSDYLTTYGNKVIRKIYADPDILTEMLLAGSVDFAVSYPPLADERFGTARLISEEIIVAASTNHPLANRESITLAELSQWEFHTQFKASKSRMSIDRILARENFYPKYCAEYPQEEYQKMARRMVDSDNYLSIIPISGLKNTYRGYKCLHISNCSFYRITALAWLEERKLQYKYKALVDHIINKFPSQIEAHARFINQYNLGLEFME